jgi:phospholipid/cholesterol/gamma-HCH transport system substrate-binding protein
MKKRSVLVSIVAAATVSGCGLTASDLPVPGGGAGGPTYRLDAVFTDALNLPNKAKVKLDGVDIGRVQGMEVDGYNARVRLAIRDEYHLPVDSTFKLRQTSALGEVYVAVSAPGTAGAQVWKDGDTIDVTHTGQAPGIEDALAALSLVTNGGGISQLTTIVRESGKALGGQAGNVRTLLQQLGIVLSTLDARSATIGSIIDKAARISTTAHRRDAVIDSALHDVGPAVKVIADQTDELVALLGSINRLSRTGERVVTTIRTPVMRLLRSMQPALDGFIAMDKDLGPVFQDMMRFYDLLVHFLAGEGGSGVLEIIGVLPDAGAPGGDLPLPTAPTPPIIFPQLPQIPLPGITLPPLPILPGLLGRSAGVTR